jgi:hypothetical protein
LLEQRIQTITVSARPASKPQLHLTAQGANLFTPDAPDIRDILSGIVLDAMIWNTGAPSIAVDWSLIIRIPNGDIVAQLTAFPEKLTLNRSSHGQTIFTSADELDLKTIKETVGPVATSGRLLFYARVSLEELKNPSTQLILSVKDALGTATTVTKKIGDWLSR